MAVVSLWCNDVVVVFVWVEWVVMAVVSWWCYDVVVVFVWVE